MNKNLERILKEQVVENVEGFPLIFPEEAEENHDECRDSRSYDFEMNLGFLEYEARVLMTR